MTIKRVLNLMMCLCVMACSLTYVSAEEPMNSVAEEELISCVSENVIIQEFNFKEVCGVENQSLDTIEEQSTRGVISSCIYFLLTSIASGLTWDYICWCYAGEVSMDAIKRWAKENGYDLAEYRVTIQKEVVDNGCRQLEFPNNPFCRVATNP